MTIPAAPTPLDAVRILRVAGGALAGQALLHAELAGLEWQEEKNRLLGMLALALLGFACLLCTLLFAGGLVLTVAWETDYRIPTLAALAVLFGGSTVAAWRLFQAQAALSNQSFAASRRELAADAAVLKASA